MSDDLWFEPESRAFSAFRRSFTTAFITSLVLLFVLPLIAGLLINWLGPLAHLTRRESSMIITACLSGCAMLTNLLLFITAIFTLLISKRARFLLVFWLGCCVSPILAIVGLGWSVMQF